MRPDYAPVLVCALLAAFGGPLVLGLAGLFGARGAPASSRPAWDWRLSLASAFSYILAFNLIFFTQELFLVLPKAMTPGLHPVLFHNNHDWTGKNPLAELFQGTGALATVIVALGAIAWLKGRPPRGATARLFLTWIAFHGLFGALPQVVVGAILPGNDVGRAMDYLHVGPVAMKLAVAAALVAMAWAGTWLARPFLDLADSPSRIDGRGRRALFVFQAATLPALASIGPILLYRVPGSWDQVIAVPVAITLIGIVWVQAGAWRAAPLHGTPVTGRPSIPIPLIGSLLVLAIFQIVLRPGIAF
jgi:hypothetical protein